MCKINCLRVSIDDELMKNTILLNNIIMYLKQGNINLLRHAMPIDFHEGDKRISKRGDVNVYYDCFYTKDIYKEFKPILENSPFKDMITMSLDRRNIHAYCETKKLGLWFKLKKKYIEEAKVLYVILNADN